MYFVFKGCNSPSVLTVTPKTVCFNIVTCFMFLDGAGSNKQHSAHKDSAKLDRETEELHRKCQPLNPQHELLTVLCYFSCYQ